MTTKRNIKEKVIEALKSGAGPTEAARIANCSLTTARYHAKRLKTNKPEKITSASNHLRVNSVKVKLLNDKAHFEKELQKVNDLLSYIEQIRE